MTQYSFGNVNFDALTGSLRRSRAADIAITHIPGSSTNIIDNGGAKERQYAGLILLANNTDFASLENLTGTSGTLIGPDGSSITAILANLERTELYIGGTTTTTAVLANAVWLEAT